MVKKSVRGGKEEMVDVNRGSWTAEEDQKLADYVRAHGDKKWRCLPEKAGLKRCGKSCRLRWLNYLRPGIKRGNISQDEEDLIIRLHNLIGNRWSLIAGRLPGRTDNEIKNHWNTHLSKRSTTIEDLNTKQTKGLADVQHDAPPPPPPTISVHPDSDMDPQNVEQTSLSDDLISGSDFDIDQLFEFTGEPILEPNYGIHVLNSNGNELQVNENSMPAGDTTLIQDLFLQVKENSNMPAGDSTATFQDLLNHAGIGTKGSYAFDSQLLCNSFQFDDLDQLIDFPTLFTL